jgi:hypothetical protein
MTYRLFLSNPGGSLLVNHAALHHEADVLHPLFAKIVSSEKSKKDFELIPLFSLRMLSTEASTRNSQSPPYNVIATTSADDPCMDQDVFGTIIEHG